MSESFMRRAIEIAGKSFPDIPIGCVIIYDHQIIIETHNEVELRLDPTAHAELLCIRRACKKLGRRNLSDCVLISTMEPCDMCEAAIKLARIPLIVFGAFKEIKPGPNLDLVGGVCEQECHNLVRKYFIKMRDPN